MADMVIILIVLLIGILGVRSYLKKLSHGCCGGGDGEPKVKVADKNASHYPYSRTLQVEGMTCAHCRQRVENALNAREGIWAKVDLEKHCAAVRMKEEVPAEELRRIVEKAGYHVADAGN